MNQYKTYFGLKDIYPDQVGNLSVDELTNSEDVYIDSSEGENIDKKAGKTVGQSSSKSVMFTMLGMFLLLVFLNKKVKK